MGGGEGAGKALVVVRNQLYKTPGNLALGDRLRQPTGIKFLFINILDAVMIGSIVEFSVM